MGYLFMVIAVIAIAGQNTLVGLFNKKVKNSSPFVLSVCLSGITLFGFLIYSQFKPQVHWITIACGLGSGAICFLNFTFLQQAVKRGPVSLTNLFISYALLIPTFFSLFVYEKQLHLNLIIGIVLLCASIAMTNKWEKKKTKTIDSKEVNLSKSKSVQPKLAKKKSANFLWLLFTLLTVCTNGSFGLLQVVHSWEAAKMGVDVNNASSVSGYMVLSMSVVFVANFIAMFCTKNNRAQIKPSFEQGWKFVLSNGVAYFIILLMQMWLVSGINQPNKMNPSIFNPVMAAGSLVLTLIASIFIFKEKLNVLQWVGVGVGVAAIAVLNVKFVQLANWKEEKVALNNCINIIRNKVGI